MQIVIRGPYQCWEKDCARPITAKTGVLCNYHRKIARKEASPQAQGSG